MQYIKSIGFMYASRRVQPTFSKYWRFILKHQNFYNTSSSYSTGSYPYILRNKIARSKHKFYILFVIKLVVLSLYVTFIIPNDCYIKIKIYDLNVYTLNVILLVIMRYNVQPVSWVEIADASILISNSPFTPGTSKKIWLFFTLCRRRDITLPWI